MSRKPRFEDIQFIFLSALSTELLKILEVNPKKKLLTKMTYTLLSGPDLLPFNLSFKEEDIEFYYTHYFKPEFVNRLIELQTKYEKYQEVHQETLSFVESLREKGKIPIHNMPYLSKKLYKEKQSSLPTTISPTIIKDEGKEPVVKLQIPTANRLKDSYFVSDTNMFWSLDVTQRGDLKICYVLAIIEAASRCILNFTYSESPFTASTVIELLERTIAEFGKPKYVHSDQGGIFVGNEVTKYLNENNIIRSLTIKSTEYSRWGNQVHEVFHRTFWASIGVVRDSKETVQAWDDLSLNQRLRCIELAIEIFNHENAKARPFYSREEIDRLLRCNTAMKLNIKAKNNTELALLIERFHLYVAVSHDGDYISALIDQVFNPESATAVSMVAKLPEEAVMVPDLIRQQTLWLTSAISSGFLAVIKELKLQRAENVKNRHIIEELQTDLDEIKSHTTALYTKDQIKEALREKRKNRKKQVSRDACTYNDYLSALSCIKNKDRLIEARNKVALTLLYMTGLRVSNLMNITYGHLERLLNKEDISITLIKTRQNHIQQTYPWQSAYSKLISSIEKEIKLLIDSKKEETSPFGLSREHLNRSLNTILDEASKLTKKNLRTHSFRINLCDQIIEKKGIHVAQKVLGHSSIGTTQLYNRTGITKRELGAVLRDTLLVDDTNTIEIEIDKKEETHE